MYWDLIEPVEGKFDWTLVDGLIRDARQNGLRLVLLWFAALLTLYTGFDYFRAGLKYVIYEH